MARHRLCALTDIEEPGSRGFSIKTSAGDLALFVVKKHGEVFGFKNICPHTGVGLDWMPHRFLDLEQALIICATHGALFEIDSGLCVSGPCIGEKLEPVYVRVVQGEIFLDTE